MTNSGTRVSAPVQIQREGSENYAQVVGCHSAANDLAFEQLFDSDGMRNALRFQHAAIVPPASNPGQMQPKLAPRRAPLRITSTFAYLTLSKAFDNVGSRYAFVPPAQFVARLRDVGWAPFSAVQQRVKLDERRGFQKDLIRFQRRHVVPVKREYNQELCRINSPHPSTADRLHAGLYWFICENARALPKANRCG